MFFLTVLLIAVRCCFYTASIYFEKLSADMYTMVSAMWYIVRESTLIVCYKNRDRLCGPVISRWLEITEPPSNGGPTSDHGFLCGKFGNFLHLLKVGIKNLPINKYKMLYKSCFWLQPPNHRTREVLYL